MSAEIVMVHAKKSDLSFNSSKSSGLLIIAMKKLTYISATRGDSVP